MATTSKRRKAKTGTKGQTATATPSPVGVAPPEITAETRDQLTLLMQELLMKTQELSFEYSTIDCNDLLKCPLAMKAKELFKVVKKLNELVRRMGTQENPSYVS